MSKTPMTPERIMQLIDAYGSDPLAFPENERDAAAQMPRRAPGLRA